MGFVGDIAGKIGNQFGFGGGANQYQAHAPVNTFQAQQANLATNNYGGGIDQASQAALAGNGQQQQFIDALTAQANGTGPSVAQNMLRQQTDQNIQSQAGAMASARGMNPALAARLIAQNGAATQQQSVGQAATMRAQEQLGTQGLLGQALAAQRGQNIGLAGTLANAQQGQNSLALQNNLGTQQLNAGVAGQNAALDLGAQQINAGVAAQNADISSKAWGGLMGGLGAAGSQFATGIMGAGGAGGAAGGGAAAAPAAAAAFASGGPVPGRAAASGDSSRNDTVPAMLSPGEVVLPRSVAQAEDAPDKAAAFVRAIQRKSSGGTVEPEGYGKVLAKQRELEQRLKLIEGGVMKDGEFLKVHAFTKGGR